MEWRPARWSVCLPLLIFPCTINSRSSLLALAHPGSHGKRAKNGCGVVSGKSNKKSQSSTDLQGRLKVTSIITAWNKAIEDIRLHPMQCSACPHSQTPLCTATDVNQQEALRRGEEPVVKLCPSVCTKSDTNITQMFSKERKSIYIVPL